MDALYKERYNSMIVQVKAQLLVAATFRTIGTYKSVIDQFAESNSTANAGYMFTHGIIDNTDVNNICNAINSAANIGDTLDVHVDKELLVSNFSLMNIYDLHVKMNLQLSLLVSQILKNPTIDAIRSFTKFARYEEKGIDACALYSFLANTKNNMRQPASFRVRFKHRKIEQMKTNLYEHLDLVLEKALIRERVLVDSDPAEAIYMIINKEKI